MKPPTDKVQAAAIQERWEALGYNKPLLIQYGIYLKNIFTKWDFGTSWYIQFRQPAWDVLTSRLLPTVLVNLYSLLLSIPLGIGLGIFAAIKKNKWQDSLISTLVMVFISCAQPATNKKVISASSMGIYKYMFNSGNQQEIMDYCNEKLKRLEMYDNANGSFLIDTLLNYYMCGFNVQKTAQMMYVHRNSLQYRLKKIEEILEISLDDSMEYLDVVNCILVKRLMFN